MIRRSASTVSKEDALEFSVDKLELEEIWPLADYIAIHTLYMPQTHSNYVSFSYASIPDHWVPVPLLDSLESEYRHGAALDVFSEEPPRPGSISVRLIQHLSIICTLVTLPSSSWISSIILLQPLPDQLSIELILFFLKKMNQFGKPWM